ncbi:hypothetical protein F443_06910 [Phytophthora nicotianae P1569]|uniref:Uncharacterized protein n=1 Tax=Phytophthora nicotianae P1569 TaxID=1317065 RepID=V9FFH6_PHYNI|nr:hypothetical protein F443_06910 [Phytophthora nicotianae P1569]
MRKSKKTHQPPLPPTQRNFKKTSKVSLKKLIGPADSDSRDEIAAAWCEGQLEDAYNRNEPHSILSKIPVMKALGHQLPVTMDKFDAMKADVRVVKEVGITAGAFKACDLFVLDLEVMHIALFRLFDRLTMLSRPVVYASPTGSLQNS